MIELEELRIRIWKIGAGRYLAYANGPATAAAIIHVANPETFAQRRKELLDRELRGGDSLGDMLKLGRELFSVLLPESLHSCLTKLLNRAGRSGRSLRIRFEIPSELDNLPIETLCAPAEDPLGVLAKNPHFTLARSFLGPAINTKRELQANEKPFWPNLLAVAAFPDADVNPCGLVDRLPTQLRIHRLGQIFGDGNKPATIGNLAQAAKGLGDKPAIALVMAHGEFDETKGGGFRLDDGESVTGVRLSAALNEAKGLRLVILHLCRGGQTSQIEPYSGLAHSLIGSGLPAVVSMGCDITPEAAEKLSEVLLKELLENAPLDVAVQRARTQMDEVAVKASDGRIVITKVEWSTPICLLNTKSMGAWLFRTADPKSDYLAKSAKADRDDLDDQVIPPERLLLAARFNRMNHNWQRAGKLAAEVPKKANVTRGAIEEAELIKREVDAEVEAKISLIPKICQSLCDGAALRLSKNLDSTVMPLFEREMDPDLEAQYGQARAHERAGRWSEAKKIYDHLAPPNDSVSFRDAFYRSIQAAARLAESEGRWQDARKEYLKLPWCERPQKCALDAFGDEKYTRVRQAAEIGQWHNAAGRASEIPADWDGRDGWRSQDWRNYLDGRCCESDRNWEKAIGFYKSNSAFLDSRCRAAYCQGRQAEEKGDWVMCVELYAETTSAEKIRERVGPGDNLPDLPTRVAYAQGRWRESQKDWPGAAACFGEANPEGKDPMYPDAVWRGGYAADRVAESQSRVADASVEAESWQKTLECYQAIPSGEECRREYRDVAVRAGYAQGRYREAVSRWKEAFSAFQSVAQADSAFESQDIAKRMSYCLGREGFEEQKWEQAVGGFGDLGDDYRDVHQLRTYARGRLNEQLGGWKKAREAYEDPKLAEFRDAPTRLAYSTGRVREMEAAWPDAAKHYEKAIVPQPDPQLADADTRQKYCEGREAEAASQWDAAVTNYASAEKGYSDAIPRGVYCKGRAGESRGAWDTAAEFLSRAIDYPDASARVRYARGQDYLAGKKWAEAETEFHQLDSEGAIYPNARDFARYASARLGFEAAENTGNAVVWRSAAEPLSLLPQNLVPELPGLLAYANARCLEASGQWSAAAQAYASLPDNERDSLSRRQRLEQLLAQIPWIDGLAEAKLARDPLYHDGEKYPYQWLWPAGITPTSTHSQVKEASFVLMEKGLMTAEARQAWDQLRQPSRRLKIDARLYQLGNSESLGSAQQQLELGAEPDLLRQLCHECEQDAPLLLLLAGRREEAVREWEAKQKAHPFDRSAAHNLAVALSALADDLENRGAYEKADQVWPQAIGQWAMVLNDDGYWMAWGQARGSCYGEMISQADCIGLRQDLTDDLLRLFGGLADQYASDGRKQRAEHCRHLARSLEAELAGAAALQSAGGAPVREGGPGALSCGPRLLRQLKLEAALGPLVARLEAWLEDRLQERDEEADIVAALEAALSGESADVAPGPDISRETLYRLRCLFSVFAEAFVLLQHHRATEALAALPPEVFAWTLAESPGDCAHRATGNIAADCPQCQQFLQRDPAYLKLPHRASRWLQDGVRLAVDAHFDLAYNALTRREGDLAEPWGHWREALTLARHTSTHVRAKQAIARVVMGRTKALQDERGQKRGEMLTRALVLIENAQKLLGETEKEAFARERASLLTLRGVWHGDGCQKWFPTDYDKAATDLREALALQQASVPARDNLARALVFHTDHLHTEGRRGDAWLRIAEAIRILHEGLRLLPANIQLTKIWWRAVEELEKLAGDEVSREISLKRLNDVLAASAAVPAELKGRGREKLQSGDVGGAILYFIDTVRLDTNDEEGRSLLLTALERQVQNLPPGQR